TLQGGGKDPMGGMRFCLLLIGHEGSAEDVDAAVARSRKIAETNQAMHLGTDLGEKWYKGRFASPYLRDPLLDHGLAVETLEPSTNWNNITNLHRAVTDALNTSLREHAAAGVGQKAGSRTSLVMAHVSHSYTDGASLYFTFVFPRDLP